MTGTTNRRRRMMTRLAVLAVAGYALVGANAPAAVAASPKAAPGHGAVKVATLASRIGKAVRVSSTTVVSMKSQGGGTSLTANGVLRFTHSGADMQFQETVGHVRVRFVYLGGVLYFRLPASLLKPGQKPWFKVSPSGKDATSKKFAPLLNQLAASTNPDPDVSRLRAGVLRPSGHRLIDGIRTTKYVLVVDPAAVRAEVKQQLRPLGAAAVRAGLAQLRRMHETTTIYVDARWLPHRVVTVLRLRSGVSIRTTVSYRRWGAPVTITAPPASQVGPLPS